MAEQRTPQQQLCEGVATSNLEMVKQALLMGANPNVGPNGEKTFFTLQRAIERAQVKLPETHALDVVRLLLEAGADASVNSGIQKGCRDVGRPYGLLVRVMMPEWRDGAAMLDMLLAHWPERRNWRRGAALDDGSPLLHNAVNENHVACVEVMAKHGADIDVRNALGETPLMLAKSEEMTRTLLRLDANPHSHDHRRHSVLWKAVGTGTKAVKTKVIHVLLDQDLDLGQEVRTLDLAKRVKRKLDKWEAHWPAEDKQALERLASALQRFHLLQQALPQPEVGRSKQRM